MVGTNSHAPYFIYTRESLFCDVVPPTSLTKITLNAPYPVPIVLPTFSNRDPTNHHDVTNNYLDRERCTRSYESLRFIYNAELGEIRRGTVTLLISVRCFDRSRFSDKCWTKFKYDSARGTNALCLCEGGEVLGVVLKLRNALRGGGREFLVFLQGRGRVR